MRPHDTRAAATHAALRITGRPKTPGPVDQDIEKLIRPAIALERELSGGVRLPDRGDCREGRKHRQYRAGGGCEGRRKAPQARRRARACRARASRRRKRCRLRASAHIVAHRSDPPGFVAQIVERPEDRTMSRLPRRGNHMFADGGSAWRQSFKPAPRPAIPRKLRSRPTICLSGPSVYLSRSMC